MRRAGSLLEASYRRAAPSAFSARPRPTFVRSRGLASPAALDAAEDAANRKHSASRRLYFHSSSATGGAASADQDTDAEDGSGSWPSAREQELRRQQQQQQEREREMAEKYSFAREFDKPRMDASFLVNNYTAPALAAAYQDREYTLWLCAELLSEGKLDELEAVLKPYHDFALREQQTQQTTPLPKAFGQRHLERIRKRLSRLPRQLTKAYSQRAAVVIPLCTFEGEPSVLFTLRSLTVGKHKGEVCFPGGMVDAGDSCIEGTCLREMNEEVGLAPSGVDVLGVLRCDWSSVTSITGIAVTPVVGFVGEMSDQTLAINEDEVESLFTVPLRDLLAPENWVRRANATPVFTGGPHVVWGLTAYLLDICLSEVLRISD